MPELKEPLTEGVQRWESWLEKTFPIACRRRQDLEAHPSAEWAEAVWQVQIRHGRHGRIRVTSEALGVSPEEFQRITMTLERKNWYGALDQHLQIRIREKGTVGAVS